MTESIFSKFIEPEPKKERPAEPEIPRGPAAQPIIPQVDVKSPPIERLIAWLFRWPKDTVFTRDILWYGPTPLRNPKAARTAAALLEKNGWLTPLPTRRYCDRAWKIERGPK